MNRFCLTRSLDSTAFRLTRRSAIGDVAKAGTVAALAAAGLRTTNVSAALPALPSDRIQRGAEMVQSTPVASPVANTPTVVLVHGAFADASSWNNVIPLLQADGIPVIAPANPLRGIASDAAYLSSVLAAIPGPVLLVGHSYGGALITSAPATVGNVVGLVYVAAFALDEGETSLGVLGDFPPTLLGPALRPVTADSTNPDVRIDPDQFHAAFAADLPEDMTRVMAVTQRPVSAAAFGEPSGAPAWKTLPSWYAVATEDQALGVELLRHFAERAGSITVEIEASHVVMLSQPEAIVALIRSALGSVA